MRWLEIKRLLKQFCFCVVVICCVSAFFAGTVTVSEKTRYNMDMTPYEKIEIIKKENELIIRYGDKSRIIETAYAKELLERLELLLKQ